MMSSSYAINNWVTKKKALNEPSYTAYDFSRRHFLERSTHRQVLLRKPTILFTPAKKANAKKVAPAKRGKILGSQYGYRIIFHN
jgi:hypothetical protein